MRLYLASTSPARRALLEQSGIDPVLVAPGVDEDAAARAEADRLGRPLTGPELVALLAVAKAEAVADGAVAVPGADAGGPAGLDGVVFGGDSAFEVDGVLYGKPHEPEVARERWRQMLAAGGGTLWSGHCVIDRRRGGAAVGTGGAPSGGVEPPVPHRDALGSAATGRTDTEPPARRAADATAGTATADDTRVARLGAVTPGGSAMVVEGDHVVAVDSAVLTFADDMTPEEVDAYVATGEPLEVAGAFTVDGRAAAYITRIDGAPSAVVGLSLPMLRSMLMQGFGIAWHHLWTL